MGGDDGLLRLEENIRSLLGGETLKEASVRHLFRLLDEQIWVSLSFLSLFHENYNSLFFFYKIETERVCLCLMFV